MMSRRVNMRMPGWTVLLGLVLLATVSVAEDKPASDKPAAVLSADKADADFAYQGEYAGNIDMGGMRVRYGAQIIALGDGKFHGIGYPGGLPGDGFIGGEKLEGDGTLKDDAVEFPGADATAVLSNGRVTVTTAGGELLGTLEKVERQSVTLGAAPPEGAVILFDGKSTDAFQNGKLSPEGWLMQGVTSRSEFQDARLHLEFLLPYMPQARGQGRANSGCYLQGRYEVQILDSFGLEGKNNECGGIYSVKAPRVNMCYPPLAWQTYDIDFTAARYAADGQKLADARMTVRHNGEVIHENVAIPKATTAAPVAEGPAPGPLYLQDHGNPVRFRNIWLVEKSR